MSDTSWVMGLKAGLMPIGMMFFYRLIASGREKPGLRGRVMSFPPILLGVGAVAFAGAVGGTVALLFHEEPAARTWGAGLTGLFIVPALLLFLNAWLVRYEVSSNGVKFRRATGSGGFFRWRDIARVACTESNREVHIDLADGRRFRLSMMLRGLPMFAKLLLANVPANVIAGSARPLIEHMAEGILPSIGPRY